ncbi:MAG: hypothetical protein RSE93_01160 [Oscillospiraceae bacterium]
MINISVKNTKGKIIKIDNILSLEYESDRFIPCDSLNFTAVMPYCDDDFTEVCAYWDNTIFFNGVIDTTKFTISSNGLLCEFICRNKTSLMIDNEAKPEVHQGVTSMFLYNTYARPFGVVGFSFPFNARLDYLQVKKGYSYWKVIEDFCRFAYGKQPYINKNNILTVKAINPILHKISNKDGVPFTSIEVKTDNYKLLSKVYMKTATYNSQYYYGLCIQNPIAIDKGIRRERYYNPNGKFDNINKEDTAKILTDINRDFYAVTVQIPAFVNINVGDMVNICDATFSKNNLYVSCVKLKIDDGIKTYITLKDRKYISPNIN